MPDDSLPVLVCRERVTYMCRATSGSRTRWRSTPKLMANFLAKSLMSLRPCLLWSSISISENNWKQPNEFNIQRCHAWFNIISEGFLSAFQAPHSSCAQHGFSHTSSDMDQGFNPENSTNEKCQKVMLTEEGHLFIPIKLKNVTERMCSLKSVYTDILTNTCKMLLKRKQGFLIRRITFN